MPVSRGPRKGQPWRPTKVRSKRSWEDDRGPLPEWVLKAMGLTEAKIAVVMLATCGASLLVGGTLEALQEKAEQKAGAPVVSAETKAILAKLEARIPMPFANETPLEDVIKYIQQATAGPDQFLIPIYVEPAGLAQAKQSMTSTITLDVENTPLKVTLGRVLEQIHLEFLVKDGVLLISSPELIDRERKELVVIAKDDSKKTKAVLAKLDEPLPDAFRRRDDSRGCHQVRQASHHRSGWPRPRDRRGLAWPSQCRSHDQVDRSDRA